ncbi:MAG: prefoldin subunit alpha [Methanomicrobiales archaeon]|jgi:prefoldin alpha subunit|nr:prefoldin subunit alpha [Methanomicrobiales archaeon]
MSPVDPKEVETLQSYLNSYAEQAQIYSRQLGVIEDGIREGVGAVETLHAIQSSEDGEVLMVIGGGASMRFRVIDPDSVLMTIGAGIVVEKGNEAAVDYLKERITEMEASSKNLTEILTRIDTQMGDISKRLEQLYAQARSEQQAAPDGN